MSDCKLCGLLALPDLSVPLPNLVLQTDTAVVVLNRKPAAPGHITIMLKAHHRQTSELIEAHLAGVGTLLGRVSRALEKIHQPQRVVLLGDGKRSAHLHLHLIPEPAGTTLDLGAIVADLSLATRAATIADEELARMAAALRNELE